MIIGTLCPILRALNTTLKIDLKNPRIYVQKTPQKAFQFKVSLVEFTLKCLLEQ